MTDGMQREARSRLAGFPVTNLEQRITGHCQPTKLQSIHCRCQLSLLFVGRPGAGDEDHSINCQGLGSGARDDQVPMMNGIERTAKKEDSSQRQRPGMKRPGDQRNSSGPDLPPN